MLQISWLCFILSVIGAVGGYPSLFETKDFRVGIEYDPPTRLRAYTMPFLWEFTLRGRDVHVNVSIVGLAGAILTIYIAQEQIEYMVFRPVNVPYSLPMRGGSDRFRHRNNYDPFFVTISASAKKGYVISYLEVSVTVDAAGEVDFQVIRGQTGSKTMTFQLVSNHSDFLSYSYLAYGIREEEYRKVTQVSQPID